MNMSEAEAYQVLGVSFEADIAKIRQEYLSLAKVWHPDRFPNDPELLQTRAQNQMKRINVAYQRLSSHRSSSPFHTPPRSGGQTRSASGPERRTSTGSTSGAKPINRRSGTPRVRLVIQIAYKFGDTKHAIDAGFARNLGRCGIAMDVTTAVHCDRTNVRFSIPGSPRDIEAEAVVVWRDGRGVGLQFKKIELTDQIAIDKFLNAHTGTDGTIVVCNSCRAYIRVKVEDQTRAVRCGQCKQEFQWPARP